MPFGIPSEDFHGGFGLPEDEVCVINYDDTDGEVDDKDDYDPYTGKYAFCPPSNEDLVFGKTLEAETLLVRALDQLYLLGYDSGFANPAVEQLVTDIKFYLKRGKI